MRHRFIIIILLALIWTIPAQALVVKYPTSEVRGQGPLPYNYRVIDRTIHAGGHPLNPSNWFRNSDQQALAILKYLKSKGVKTIIDLERTWWIQKRYQKLLKQTGLKRLHIPLHSSKLPTAKEWQQIKAALKHPVYIHCKWGADRTGSVIGRYLVEEKAYASKEAWQAVISNGSHAGYLGGLKKGRPYEKLKLFIWRGPQ